MGFTAPLGLLALLAVPVVLVLHLFRRRFEERRVAGLFLFAPDALPAAAGPTRARLLRTPSLWLELFAALVLGLLLAGLHVGARAAQQHLVVVLDDSASMAAVGPAGDTRERARRWIGRRLDDLDEDAAVTVVLTGARPDVLAGPRASVAQARAALAAWEPAQPAHDPAGAFELGQDLAGADGDLVFVTDQERLAPPPRYRAIGVGEALPNAAIVGARRVLRGAQERVFVDLMAFGDEALSTRVVLEALGVEGEREILARAVTLTPGRTLHLAWTVPAAALPLRVRLDEDALATDGAITLLPEPPRVVPVHVALDDETAASLRLPRVLAALDEVAVVAQARAARVVFAAEPGAVAGGAIQVVVAAPGEERDAWIGPFLLERKRVLGGVGERALLEGLSLEGVVWSAGRGALPGLPLVLAGEQALLTEEAAPSGPRLFLNLDAAHSNLCASPDWPILLANLVAHARAGLPGPVAANVRVGREIALRFEGAPEAAAGLSLVDPAGAARPARGWRLLTWEARRAGLHRLMRGEDLVATFAVNFVDPAESDLTQRGDFDLPARAEPAAAGATAGPRGDVEGRVLALLLLLALLADIVVLGRRR